MRKDILRKNTDPRGASTSLSIEGYEYVERRRLIERTSSPDRLKGSPDGSVDHLIQDPDVWVWRRRVDKDEDFPERCLQPKGYEDLT